jgi:hypothetical protein
VIEQWKDVPGFGDNYQASTLGRVRAKDRVVLDVSPRMNPGGDVKGGEK